MNILPASGKRIESQTEPVATIYCEGEFGKLDGKTANGLVRQSETYRIASVIDSTLAGQDAGIVLDGRDAGIPILANLDEAVEHAKGSLNHFIFGKAPATGMLSQHERQRILGAIDSGLHIVNGLHEFLADDARFSAAAELRQVTIRDIRRPPPQKDLRVYTGAVGDLPCRRIAILGTDCAIGKRTTATLLVQALNDRGVKAVLVNTGQTGLIQGGKYGLAMDAVPSQFCAGELEATIVEAYNDSKAQVIVIEGQGSLSHPAFSTSSFILRGSMPDGVILQHAPRRPHRCDFPNLPMPSVDSEINLIERFSDTRVIGLTINHEGMSDSQLAAAIESYQVELGLPVTDAIRRPIEDLADMVCSAFPELEPVAPVTK